MDTLEAITATTSFEDEIAFLRFARRNKDVRLISQSATLDGPVYLSINDLPRLKSSRSPDDQAVLLWNTKLMEPLCWRLYLFHYNHEWEPVVLNHPSSQKNPRTTGDFLALHDSLKAAAITPKMFAYGYYEETLSPVIRVSFPPEGDSSFVITADFCNWVYQGVWIVWDAGEECWTYERRDLNRLADERFEKGADFIRWQETLFDWIRANWADKIDWSPSWTYRF